MTDRLVAKDTRVPSPLIVAGSGARNAGRYFLADGAGRARTGVAGISAGVSRSCVALQRDCAGGFAGGADRLVLCFRGGVGTAGRGRRRARRRRSAGWRRGGQSGRRPGAGGRAALRAARTGGNTGGNPGGGTRGNNPGNNPGNNGGINNPNNPNNNGRNNNGGYNNPNDPNNPFNRNSPYNNPSRLNIPEFPHGATDNQQIMYMLAEGTGGFVINNTNDMAGGMQKIGKEQNQYYIVGYTPPESAEGSCHTLKVKVDKGGTTVRSRAGYCNVKSRDGLAGNPIEKTLESRATATAAGTIAASMRAPFFYTGANTARVAVAIEIPSEAIKFEKVKGKMHAGVNVLGIAYKQDGSVAARFSDAVKLDLENQKEVQSFKERPMHYENQFDVAVGEYSLKVVFDSGEASFGKLEAPLVINAYEASDFAVSGIAFSKVFGKVTDADSSLDSLLLEGRSPLVAGNYQFTPTGYSKFKAADKVVLYFELVRSGADGGDEAPGGGADAGTGWQDAGDEAGYRQCAGGQFREGG